MKLSELKTMFTLPWHMTEEQTKEDERITEADKKLKERLGLEDRRYSYSELLNIILDKIEKP